MIKCCDTCKFAEYQSLPYGSTYAVDLCGCKLEDELSDEDFECVEKEVACSKYQEAFDEEEEKYLLSLLDEVEEKE